MEVALGLAPTNRFVLRAAARLFVHLGEAQRAHDLLRKGELVASDPWLSAAEIAVSAVADRPSRTARRALAWLKEKDLAPKQLTELASAVGTLELYNGKSSSARKLFRQSLVDPNDNAVAQATWASRRLNDFTVDEELLKTPRSYEARAWRHFFDGDWTQAVAECHEWLFDEPFSTRPAELGSFVASFILRDHRAALRLVEMALSANPAHWGLWNNKALALANLGRIDEAEDALNEIPPLPDENVLLPIVRATRGLIRFRSGDVVGGRADYEWAIEKAKGLAARVRLIATVHLAEEEIRAATPEARAALERAKKMSAEPAHPDVLVALGRLETVLDGMSTASGASAAKES